MNRLVLPDDGEAKVAELIRAAQRLLFKHPVAAQAAYRALVAEGERFGATGEGQAWRARLQSSEALRRCRPLWEAATLNVLDAGEVGILPGALIDLIAQAGSSSDLEATVTRLTEGGTS